MQNDFDQNISKKTYLYWYEKFGSHKSKRLIQQRTQKKFIQLFIVLITGVIILTAYSYFKNHKLDTIGIKTNAVIEKIEHYTYSDIFHGPVNNYHIVYKYIIDSNEVSKTQEILIDEYELYFDSNVKIGDSISIKYDPEQPNNSRIEKIAQLLN